ncbi:CAP domain-containing protein [Corynebacterium afermentans]|uniref:CAP domain-containing protein n=1 Tax=Corynebacterium afermentans TaxID=38286 RepID=UPI0030B84E33
MPVCRGTWRKHRGRRPFNSHSPEAAFEQWRTSPGHNRNMLSNARAVGIGAAHGYVAGHGWGYIVVMQAR